jgi:hypothetical protein
MEWRPQEDFKKMLIKMERKQITQMTNDDDGKKKKPRKAEEQEDLNRHLID